MAASKGKVTKGDAAEAPQSMEIGPDLFVEWVDVTSLKEQDVNAQQMQPRHFDRLTENIRIRGALESLAYCHQPGGAGPISVISGHHRTRAARVAGMRQVPVIVDKRDMTRSQIISKQIAHNELHGDPDEDILRQLLAAIDNVDDLLATGLDDDMLPGITSDDTQLLLPHAEFDWRLVTFTFLPAQLEEFDEIIRQIDQNSTVVGVADVAQFQAFSKALIDVGRIRDIKNMGVVITTLLRIAKQEIEAHQATQAKPSEG